MIKACVPPLIGMPTESVVRQLRNRVYGQESSDANWEGCRDHWMKPDAVSWLMNRRENKSHT